MTYVPPPAPGPLRPLDLAQPKDIGALLTSAWRIWRARPTVFLLTAMVVAVAPIAAARILSVFVVDDFASRLAESSETLSDRVSENSESLPSDLFPGIEWSDAQWPVAVFGLEMLVTGILVPALVTATHARAVTALAQGDDVGGREALRRGLQVFASSIWAILIYGAFTVVGFLFFVIPGIWLSIAGIFTTTVVALSVAKGFGALRESLRVVRRAGWWRTFGAALVVFIVGYVLAVVPLAAVGALIGSDDAADAVKVGGAVIEGIIQAALLSWTALALTLLFFSHKARIGESYVPPPGSAPIELPGGSDAAPDGRFVQPGQWGQGQQPGQGTWQQGGGYQGGWGQSSGGGQGQQGPFGVPPTAPPGDGPIFHRPGREPRGWQQGQPPAGWQAPDQSERPPAPPEGGHDPSQPWPPEPPQQQPPRFMPPGRKPPADDE